MHRDSLLQLLHDYRNKHPSERTVTEQFEKFVNNNTDCFERSLTVGHVTGSAWLVDSTGTRVLLTHHRKLNLWLQLGGHADGNANILEVASCEASEESGINAIEPVSKSLFDIDIHSIPARGNEPAHLHYDTRFALRTIGNECFTVSEESHALAWIPVDALHTKTTEESILRMAAKWQSFANSM